jgi:predicted metal-dependent peptidase
LQRIKIMTIQLAKTAVSNAIVRITTSSNPFLSRQLFRIVGSNLERVQYTDSIPTFATDGSNLLINPEYCLSLTARNLVFVILHETAHVLLAHHLRRPADCDHSDWNVYCDYVINRLLVEDGLKLPNGALLNADPRTFTYSAEDFHRVAKQQQDDQQGDQGDDQQGDQQGDQQDDQQGDQQGDQGDDQQGDQGDQVADYGGTGAILDGTNDDGSALTDAERAAAIDENDNAQIVDSLTIKDASENSPFTTVVKSKTETRRDWVEILREYVTPVEKTGRSFRSPNKRQAAYGDVLIPAASVSEGGTCCIALDTSSSVDDDSYSKVTAECQRILDDGFEFTLVKFTSTIVDVTEYSAGDLIDTTRSRGSTCTTDVIKFANDNNFETTVIFTDGYINHDKTQQPAGDVLWIIDATGRCPAAQVGFGDSVKLEGAR